MATAYHRYDSRQVQLERVRTCGRPKGSERTAAGFWFLDTIDPCMHHIIQPRLSFSFLGSRWFCFWLFMHSDQASTSGCPPPSRHLRPPVLWSKFPLGNLVRWVIQSRCMVYIRPLWLIWLSCRQVARPRALFTRTHDGAHDCRQICCRRGDGSPCKKITVLRAPDEASAKEYTHRHRPGPRSVMSDAKWHVQLITGVL